MLGRSRSRHNRVNLKIKFLHKGVGPGNVTVVAVVCALYYKRVPKSRSLNEVTSEVETHEYISHYNKSVSLTDYSSKFPDA